MIVKICGVRTLEDALAAVEAGADMLGLNFYSRSPRYLPPEDAARIAVAMRKESAGTILVGVFVNASPAEVSAMLKSCGLDLAQLSGDESILDAAQLGERAFKTIRGTDLAELSLAFNRYAKTCGVPAGPAVLIDAALPPGQYGGEGVQSDWSAAAAIAARYPILLAGGLTPGNVGDAVAAVQPWGVDVASGVESSPGVKDAAKMRAFVRAARGI